VSITVAIEICFLGTISRVTSATEYEINNERQIQNIKIVAIAVDISSSADTADKNNSRLQTGAIDWAWPAIWAFSCRTTALSTCKI